VVHVSGGNAVRSRDDRRAERTGPVLFYRQVVAELRKVIWPSWGELRTMTFVVIVTVVVVSLMLGLIDYLLAHSLVKIEFPRG